MRELLKPSSPAQRQDHPAHRWQRRAQALVHPAARGRHQQLRFAGLPLGHEFTSLVLALLWTGGHPPKVEQDVLDQIKALDGDFNFEVYMSLSCHNCPDVVQALSLMAILNPRIKTTVIEGGAFQEEVNRAKSWPCPWCS
jgi:alkyl hydroperoxide reductase subunit F